MSGREKIWFDNRVIWIHLPDDIEEEEEPDDLWPDLMLALECLTKQQRFVIECRYGLRAGVSEPMTHEEIGWILQVSKQAIQQIEARAIERMQKHVDGGV